MDEVARADGLPPGQAGPAGAQHLVDSHLAAPGADVLRPIEVEPFLREVDGVAFGRRVTRFDGVVSVTIEPGDFIAYHAPWDGLDDDT